MKLSGIIKIKILNEKPWEFVNICPLKSLICFLLSGLQPTRFARSNLGDQIQANICAGSRQERVRVPAHQELNRVQFQWLLHLFTSSDPKYPSYAWHSTLCAILHSSNCKQCCKVCLNVIGFIQFTATPLWGSCICFCGPHVTTALPHFPLANKIA